MHVYRYGLSTSSFSGSTDNMKRNTWHLVLFFIFGDSWLIKRPSFIAPARCITFSKHQYSQGRPPSRHIDRPPHLRASTLKTAMSCVSSFCETELPVPFRPVYSSTHTNEPSPNPGTSLKLAVRVSAPSAATRPTTTPSVKGPAKYLYSLPVTGPATPSGVNVVAALPSASWLIARIPCPLSSACARLRKPVCRYLIFDHFQRRRLQLCHVGPHDDGRFHDCPEPKVRSLFGLGEFPVAKFLRWSALAPV